MEKINNWFTMLCPRCGGRGKAEVFKVIPPGPDSQYGGFCLPTEQCPTCKGKRFVKLDVNIDDLETLKPEDMA